MWAVLLFIALLVFLFILTGWMQGLGSFRLRMEILFLVFLALALPLYLWLIYIFWKSKKWFYLLLSVGVIALIAWTIVKGFRDHPSSIIETYYSRCWHCLEE